MTRRHLSSGETLSSMILCPPTLGTTSYELKAAATVRLTKVNETHINYRESYYDAFLYFR